MKQFQHTLKKHIKMGHYIKKELGCFVKMHIMTRLVTLNGKLFPIVCPVILTSQRTCQYMPTLFATGLIHQLYGKYGSLAMCPVTLTLKTWSKPMFSDDTLAHDRCIWITIPSSVANSSVMPPLFTRLVCVAMASNTSQANLFLLFISKEEENMAAP